VQTAETLEKIELAKREIELAERALDEALRLIELVPKAEKITISAALELALSRLQAARQDLEELQNSNSPTR
jgi:hypothetical protein